MLRTVKEDGTICDVYIELFCDNCETRFEFKIINKDITMPISCPICHRDLTDDTFDIHN